MGFTLIGGSKHDFSSMLIIWDAIGINGVLISRDNIADAFMLAKCIRNHNKDIKTYGDFVFDTSDLLKRYEECVQGIVMPPLVLIVHTEKVEQFNLCNHVKLVCSIKLYYSNTSGKAEGIFPDIHRMDGIANCGIVSNSQYALLEINMIKI